MQPGVCYSLCSVRNCAWGIPGDIVFIYERDGFVTLGCRLSLAHAADGASSDPAIDRYGVQGGHKKTEFRHVYVVGWTLSSILVSSCIGAANVETGRRRR